MTTTTSSVIGAPLTSKSIWPTTNWVAVDKTVSRLQIGIAKATQEGHHGKARALQWLLTHSHYGKLSAVKRVVQNKGRKTAGVDGVIWQTSQQKTEAVASLQRRGYQTQPLRRIYIPKKNGKQRPLGIPTMSDRAQQALHLLALEPIAETQADLNAYGFRPKRSTADAISGCFTALSRKQSAKWILEGDIKGCFDNIDHNWLLQNIPMDKKMLAQWLKAGFIESGICHPTLAGTPQGGIISPTLMVMVLSGLERAVQAVTTPKDKAHTIIYADDFVITGVSKEVLEQKVKPVVIEFLRKRGLELSLEKTRITHIDQGFDFLGFNVRKYKGKLLIKPSKKNVQTFLANIRDVIKSNPATKTKLLLRQLNPRILGWSSYYRHVVSKATFVRIDDYIFKLLWKWAKRRHPHKSASWRRKKYYRSDETRNWIFHATTQEKLGKKITTDLFYAAKMPIKRHIKIRGDANPFDPTFAEYLRQRDKLFIARQRMQSMGER